MGDGVVGYEKQPALCFPNVQAAFYFSGSPHPQRIHNQLKHIRMPTAAGVVEVKRIVSDGLFRQQLDQLPRMEC